MSAKKFKLDNLIIIVDKNNYQQTGETVEILDLKNLTNKFKSFGCDTLEIDGHNYLEIYKALKSKNFKKKPKVIVANTIKGKGFKLFENDNNWHHSVVTSSIYKEILKEFK